MNEVMTDAELKRLEYLLKYWLLNKKQFAWVLGVKPPLVTYYFQKKKRPGRNVLKKLAQYGISINWYLLGEGHFIKNQERHDRFLLAKRQQALSK